MTIDMFTQSVERENEFGRQLQDLCEKLKLPRVEFFGERCQRCTDPEAWIILVKVRGRESFPHTDGFSFRTSGSSWQDGLNSAAQETLGRLCRIYEAELEGTPFEMFAQRSYLGQPTGFPTYSGGSRRLYGVQRHISALDHYAYETRDALDAAREEIYLLKRERQGMLQKIDALEGKIEGQKREMDALEDKVSTLEEALEEAKDEGEQLQDRLDNDALISDDEDYEEDPESHESEPEYGMENFDDDEEMEEEDPEERVPASDSEDGE